MSRTLKITPTESVTVQVSKPELLEVEAVYAPAGKEPPKHYHPSQDEHFEVLEGSIRVRAGDEERTLGVGDEIDIARGTVHKMWNPASGDARVLWQTRPAGAPRAGSPRSMPCIARAGWGGTGCRARWPSPRC